MFSIILLFVIICKHGAVRPGDHSSFDNSQGFYELSLIQQALYLFQGTAVILNRRCLDRSNETVTPVCALDAYACVFLRVLGRGKRI